MSKMKLVTAVTTEPITLAQVKSHLRLDSAAYADDVATYQCIAPGSHNTASLYSLVGTAVDVLGKKALVNLNSGTNGAGGTVDVKIQESDDNIAYTDWTGGAFTQITTATDNAVYEKEYTGTKRYIRVVCTVAVAACEFAVDIIVNSGSTAEDAQISAWITVAREYGENLTSHAFAAQTWDMILDDFPAEDYINWEVGPLTSITSIKYKNYLGVETTMTPTTQYLVDADTFPGRIFLPYNVSWPSFTPYPYNGVIIRGVCGYTGTAPYIIPDCFKQAMLMHTGLLYKYRDQEIPLADLETIRRLYRLSGEVRL